MLTTYFLECNAAENIILKYELIWHKIDVKHLKQFEKMKIVAAAAQ